MDDFAGLLTEAERRDYDLMRQNITLERECGIIDPNTGDAPSAMDLHLWAIQVRLRRTQGSSEATPPDAVPTSSRTRRSAPPEDWLPKAS